VGDAAGFLNAAVEHVRAQSLLVGGIEIAAQWALTLDCLQVQRLSSSEWHSPDHSADLERLTAATWFLATDACSRKALTC
jgi:hypothetical protein